MASQPAPWSLTLPSDLRQLVLARAFLEAVCEVCGLDRSTTDAVVLAAHEAINNVIRHAHLDCPDAQLQIQCFHGPDGLEIHLLDEGAPFDLASVPSLDPAEERVGGRGVFLMRKLMDELSCHPRGERGNTLRMVKRCAVSAKHSPDDFRTIGAGLGTEIASTLSGGASIQRVERRK